MAVDPRGNDLPAGLSQPAQRALAGAGITTLDQLARYREKDIMALHGIGPRALDLLRETMAARGLSFAGSDRDMGKQP